MHPDSTILVPLTQGKFAIIDAEDADRVLALKWTANRIGNKWYAIHRTKEGTALLHRFILDMPPGLRVDHINGDGLDCRRTNMREATHGENLRNRGKQRNNTSGYKGVFWDRRRGLWLAKIQHERRQINIGRFADPIDAAHAYDAAALVFHGKFARLNFPDDH